MTMTDRYGTTDCVGSGREMMEQPVETHAKFIRLLQANEFKQTATMFKTYPAQYDQRVADTNNRRYEGNSYMLLEMVGEKWEVTPKGARILVESGLALAMSQAYYCARNELVLDRSDPTNVRDAFESIQRMAALWLPAIWKLDAQLVPEEITNNTRMDGEEDQDLAEVMERIRLIDTTVEYRPVQFGNMNEQDTNYK